jgi:23S rRNA pseudouridine955/2504/2580 synthase
MNKVETRTVTADEAEMRLDRWFGRHFPTVRHGQLEKLLRTGQIRVDGGRVKAAHRLAAGQEVRIPPLPASDANPPKPKPRAATSERDAKELRQRILYRDADVLVIDKPAGLAVQGGTGQDRHLDAMLDALTLDAAERPRLVHRLDKDTSGCLALARTASAARALTALFRGRTVRKIYWAIAVGVPHPLQGVIDAALAKEEGTKGERMAHSEDGDEAVTVYSVLERAHKQASFVALWPRTGRTHQLRAHMALIGTPILGDGKYAGQEAFLSGADLPRTLHLHARRLILPKKGGGTIDATAPLPTALRSTWDYLGFQANRKDDPFEDYD